ncbi:hypothetical protein CASFOL_000869 [Castilleja foliolosa]|uniref:Uncharacterized protein n=1 Tax=Castilleja foliolosa TaxID=1961234 RepID=A0ABD3EL80_9LAMI
MDIGSPRLKPALSFRRKVIERTTSTPSSSDDGEYDTDTLPRYTSLKDIIVNSSPKYSTSNNDPSNISIRNELVKHAASAYVLSATIISPPSTGQDWFPCQLCEDVKNISCVDLQSCWETHVRSPLQALYRPVVDFFYQVVHRIGLGLRRR